MSPRTIVSAIPATACCACCEPHAARLAGAAKATGQESESIMPTIIIRLSLTMWEAFRGLGISSQVTPEVLASRIIDEVWQLDRTVFSKTDSPPHELSNRTLFLRVSKKDATRIDKISISLGISRSNIFERVLLRTVNANQCKTENTKCEGVNIETKCAQTEKSISDSGVSASSQHGGES
jgi:hypothetical protein